MKNKVMCVRLFIADVRYDLEQPTADRTDDTTKRRLVTNQPTDFSIQQTL
jgi:hypothetical protein